MADRRVTWKDIDTLADRESDVRAICNRILDAWGYNLEERKPGVASIDADGKPITDLDLVVFLDALVEARAGVNLPKYKASKARTVRKGEMIISSDNRHGRIMGLFSNADTASFGIRIEDANVMVADEETGEVNIGRPTNLTIQRADGAWYPGWQSIEILPVGLPGKVFNKLSGAARTLKFKHFINPSRWPSLYGKYYAVAKAAIIRLKDERSFIGKEITRLRNELGIEKKSGAESYKDGKEKKIQVWAYECELDGFALHGEYTSAAEVTKKELKRLTALNARLGLFYERLRFLTRATEFAFWKYAVLPEIGEEHVLDWLKGNYNPGAGHGSEENGVETLQPRRPIWTKKDGKVWDLGYRQPGKRTDWARLELQENLHLRFRARKKTEWIADDSDDEPLKSVGAPR